MAKTRAVDSSLEALLRKDHTLYGGVLFGLDGHTIQLQARAVRVEPQASWRGAVRISGMARGSVHEALDRISGAFAKLEIDPPQVEILINLAPPDLPKDGTWLDVPLAVIMLQAAGVLPDLSEATEDKFVLVGEIGLHGEIRRVPGVLSMAYAAKPGQTLVVPEGNERECALILAKPGHEGCRVSPVAELRDLLDFFRGKRTLKNALSEKFEFEQLIPKCVDFSEIRGQAPAKQAAEIAAAGGHNLLLIGPPGEGKSLLASALPGILPRLMNDEVVELTRIYSACGRLDRDGLAVTRRPFRNVHHTATKQALIGGGSGIPTPGEVTLSHRGVLFLDELAEFSRATLETLRQPLEDGAVSISRVHASLTFPSRFSLVAAMNPCPCGYFGTTDCKCKEADVRKYQGKLSGPILDRIDLQVELVRLTTDERFAEATGESSESIRARVQKARVRQLMRFDGQNIPCNAAMPGGRVRELCAFSEPGLAAYKAKVEASKLTTRSIDRLAKVARTVADLAESTHVEPAHIDHAAAFVIGGMLRDSN